MAKVNINYVILVVFTLLVATQINVNARKLDDEGDELELDYICLHNQKLAKIHFYLQGVVGGPNSTMHEVARANVSTEALFSFGKIYVFDDLITAGPGGNSLKLGKAQGIVTSADMRTTAMAENFNAVFTSGVYNGSTLTIAGRNPAMDQQRHLAVIGGTGVFRFTRGFAVVGTYSSRVGVDSVFYVVFEYSINTTFCPLI